MNPSHKRACLVAVPFQEGLQNTLKMTFNNMSQPEQDFLTTLQANEATMRAEIVQMKQLIQMQADAGGFG